ncbi:MAG: hypothetical protein JEZ09_20630 [Salinivirgaceae bacterium]|nr:hypothetical protein [Salinivirgaceae bacterium]
MKKVTLLFFSLAAVVTLSSCGGSKEAASPKGFNEIVVPCADQGRSDATMFRASSSATSRDMATCREKALLMTKQRLASLISSTMKSVTERYVNEMEVADASNFEQTFENMTRDIVKQKLVEVAITCEKVGQKEDGSYETYMALEVSKDVIYNGIDKGIAKDKKLEVMYDREKFKAKFDEEMDKMSSEY